MRTPPIYKMEPSYLKLPSAAPPLAESEPPPTETEEEPPTKSEGVSGLRGLAMDSHYSECYPGYVVFNRSVFVYHNI